MGSFSIAHWLIVAFVVLVLFGRGKISGVMTDFGHGVRAFRQGVAEDDSPDQLSESTTAEVQSQSRKSPNP